MLLKILDISLKGLDSWSKSLAKPFIKLELLEKDTENLLKKTEEKLKKRGARKINLGVANSNLEKLPFYTKHGYTLVKDAVWLDKKV